MPEDPIKTAIVIPAYNAAAFIEKAVASCLGQTTPPNEVIVVDDGSSDGTAAFAEKAGARVIVSGKGNANIARNLGANSTDADLLFFLDADDWLMPDKIQSHLETRAKHDVCVVIDPTTRITEEGVEFGFDGPRLGGPIVYSQFTSRTYWYCTSGFSVRRDDFRKIGGFREDITSEDDTDFCIRLCHECGPGFVMDSSHTYHLKNPTSVSHNPKNIVGNMRQVLSGLPFLSAGERRRFWCHVMVNTADQLPLPQSLPYLRRAMVRPADPRLLKALVRTTKNSLARSRGA